ncbi:MAG: GtrA family protein [Acetatifactor sp.]
MERFGKLIHGIIRFIFCDLLKMREDAPFLKGFEQFIKFGIVGVSNTILSYLLYILSIFSFQKLGIFLEIDYLLAQVIAFVLSVLWSFYWNNKYVFDQDENSERNLLKALAKTYASYAFTGLILNGILSVLWVEVFHLSKLIAPVINLLVSVPVNFLLNKFWAFHSKSRESK